MSVRDYESPIPPCPHCGGGWPTNDNESEGVTRTACEGQYAMHKGRQTMGTYKEFQVLVHKGCVEQFDNDSECQECYHAVSDHTGGGCQVEITRERIDDNGFNYEQSGGCPCDHSRETAPIYL